MKTTHVDSRYSWEYATHKAWRASRIGGGSRKVPVSCRTDCDGVRVCNELRARNQIFDIQTHENEVAK